MRVSAQALEGSNAALDVAASLPRYLEELQLALRRELPEVALDLAVGADECRVFGASEGRRAALELRALGVARAVRHCGRWAVYG